MRTQKKKTWNQAFLCHWVISWWFGSDWFSGTHSEQNFTVFFWLLQIEQEIRVKCKPKTEGNNLISPFLLPKQKYDKVFGQKKLIIVKDTNNHKLKTQQNYESH